MKKYLALLVLGFLFPVGCEKIRKTEPAVTPAPPEGQLETFKQEEAESPSLSVANVILFLTGQEAVTLTVEIAQTPEERRQGLQGREDLPDHHGMWFIFEQDGQDPFWMHNTPLSLDLLFIDKDYKIVDMVENTVPNSDTLIVSREPYRYALEIKAGSVAAFGVAVGNSVEFRLGPP